MADPCLKTPIVELVKVEDVQAAASVNRDWRFWLIFTSIAVSLFLTALELTAVSTALPTIVSELHGTDFVWIAASYALASTAFVPMSGVLAQAFGRRPVMMGSLILFAVGSALCGAAKSMNVLIVGRTIQGIGGGGIASLTQIILSDIVPLHERGVFNGIIGVSWSVASGIGPVIGGSLAQSGSWRWLFYLNIPICGLAMLLVFLFLRLRTPEGTLKEKLGRLDWIGNFIVISSTASCVIALTWSGIKYEWSSLQVLVPLIVGIAGLVAFLGYEAKVSKCPMVPLTLMSTSTGLSGYLQTFIMPIILIANIYYTPVYFQSCLRQSPIASGVDTFGFAFTVAPIGIISGFSVAKIKQYRPQLWISWVLVIIGSALESTLRADSPRILSIGYTMVIGAGLGILTMTTYFPVLAPIHVSQNASALALFTFLRNFAQVWGVSIGGTILQNKLATTLPADFKAQFPEGGAIAYAIIPIMHI
ncbi:hypothetical protein HGRIS_012733 [Hohenbuehelia grisea]|uniref:Major facilitator superfamily (MFS) profile domain-containing protein n=1 Tax=Hohenbuehelia grisea TaxID=104357 RepID=A0ABR3ITA7_9AGAR